jgi:hypothetical protein
MHKIYLAWFLWGFWAHFAFVGLILVTAGVCVSSLNAGLITISISVGLFAVNSFVWLICGGIWRFSKGGMTASGDRLLRPDGTTNDVWDAQIENAMVSYGYQIKSGRFLRIYLGLAIFAVILIVFALIVMAVIMCCCTGNKEGEETEENSADKEKGISFE